MSKIDAGALRSGVFLCKFERSDRNLLSPFDIAIVKRSEGRSAVAASTNMERSGVSTDIGNLNRDMRSTKQFIASVHDLIEKSLD